MPAVHRPAGSHRDVCSEMSAHGCRAWGGARWGPRSRSSTCSGRTAWAWARSRPSRRCNLGFQAFSESIPCWAWARSRPGRRCKFSFQAFSRGKPCWAKPARTNPAGPGREARQVGGAAVAGTRIEGLEALPAGAACCCLLLLLLLLLLLHYRKQYLRKGRCSCTAAAAAMAMFSSSRALLCVASTHMELLPAAADCRDGCASVCDFTSVGTLKGECWPVSQESKKRHIKPGESREAKQHKVFIDEEGRQRHVMSLDDKLVGVVRA